MASRNDMLDLEVQRNLMVGARQIAERDIVPTAAERAMQMTEEDVTDIAARRTISAKR